MPTPSLNDALEARDGTLWIASNGAGLFRLSPKAHGPDRGSLFAPVQLSGSAAANRVNVLLEDRSGGVWLGTDGGLFRLDGAPETPRPRAVPLGLRGVADDVQVRALAEGADGS